LGPNDADLRASVAAQVAVLDFTFWRQRYGGAPDVVGKTIKIEGVPYTIVGVTRQGFRGFDAEVPPQITVPLNAQPLLAGAGGKVDVQKTMRRPTALWLDAAGRLRDGTALQRARAQLE